MQNVPIYVNLIFWATSIIAIPVFFKATNRSTPTIFILSAWLIFQIFPSVYGFYLITDTLPPRFLLLVAPPFLFIFLLFITPFGRKYLDSLNIKRLTLFHMIRIPVEFVLFLLCIHKAVPELMTFEGRNFDILSGISAPFIYYYGFVKQKLNKKIILVWNFICLGLLLNIVISAVLSAPFPFQQFAFDQPNIAVLYFPFTWLPSLLVPLVLLSHLASIRQLLLSPKK